MTQLTGKTALVTGAFRGIGRASALAKHGADVLEGPVDNHRRGGCYCEEICLHPVFCGSIGCQG
jgi:NAD(P)-dependent dehydrogenase (short-subunit alcohol dehydrogenase family)